MTKSELIKRLNDMDDKVIIVTDVYGWSNIEDIKEQGGDIIITLEKYPVFSDN